MGLDMIPIGKPKPGFENRFLVLFELLAQDAIPKVSFWNRLIGKKGPTREELLEEFNTIQIVTFETIKAPKVGRDPEADEWIIEQYNLLDEKPDLLSFLKELDGYYVIELAKELDGVPVYMAMNQDKNVFRGQFLQDCIDIIGEDLVNEAWETKLANETLDYGNRLMAAAESIAKEHNLGYLKHQRLPPEYNEDAIECKLHIVYSLAKWLIFYASNGHGYEADY